MRVRAWLGIADVILATIQGSNEPPVHQKHASSTSACIPPRGQRLAHIALTCIDANMSNTCPISKLIGMARQNNIAVIFLTQAIIHCRFFVLS